MNTWTLMRQGKAWPTSRRVFRFQSIWYKAIPVSRLELGIYSEQDKSCHDIYFDFNLFDTGQDLWLDWNWKSIPSRIRPVMISVDDDHWRSLVLIYNRARPIEEEEDRPRSISRTQFIRSYQLDRQSQVHGPKHCDTVIKHQPPCHMGLKVVSAWNTAGMS